MFRNHARNFWAFMLEKHASSKNYLELEIVLPSSKFLSLEILFKLENVIHTRKFLILEKYFPTSKMNPNSKIFMEFEKLYEIRKIDTIHPRNLNTNQARKWNNAHSKIYKSNSKIKAEIRKKKLNHARKCLNSFML